MPIAATSTYNTDILGLVKRINGFITEIAFSNSANVNNVSEKDLARSNSYLNALREYKAWFTAQPPLDMTKTGMIAVLLPLNAAIPNMQNHSLWDLCTMLESLRDEMANSDSSRMPTGMLGFDVIRFDDMVSKAQKFLDTYIKKVDPLDQPETSPMHAVTGPGKTGV